MKNIVLIPISPPFPPISHFPFPFDAEYMIFKDRIEAGKKLAEALFKYKGREAIVYALPRGGVVLGIEVARALNASLDLVIPRKIGHPTNPEYAVCAVSESGELICDEGEKRMLDPKWLRSEIDAQVLEAKRRRATYLKGRDRMSSKDKVAIIVDDGIATGLTMRSAIAEIRKDKPKKIVIATPAAPHDVTAVLRKEVDEVIVLTGKDGYLGAVGAYYKDFPQVSDDEVVSLLA